MAFCWQNETEWKGLRWDSWAVRTRGCLHVTSLSQEVCSPSGPPWGKRSPKYCPRPPGFQILELLPCYCSSQSCWNCWNNPIVILPHLSFNLQLSPVILISITFLKQWFSPSSFRMFCRFKNICFLFDQHLPVLYLCLQTQPPACTPTLTDSIFVLFSGFISHFCLSLTLLQSLSIYPLLLET